MTAAQVLKGQRHFSTPNVVESEKAHGYKVGRQKYPHLAANQSGNKYSPSIRSREIIKGTAHTARWASCFSSIKWHILPYFFSISSLPYLLHIYVHPAAAVKCYSGGECGHEHETTPQFQDGTHIMNSRQWPRTGTNPTHYNRNSWPSRNSPSTLHYSSPQTLPQCLATSHKAE